MVEFLTSIYDKIMEISVQSPVVAGVISLWGVGVVTFLFRNVPSKIITFLKRQLTTTLEFDNATTYFHEIIYYSCMNWFHSNSHSLKLTRVFSIQAIRKWNHKKERNEENVSVGPGYGTHIFLYQKKIMWMTVSALESSGSEKQKRSITLTTLGRRSDIFESFVEEFKPEEEEDELSVYRFSSDGWQKETTLIKRPIESVALEPTLKEFFISEISHFKNNREWFLSKGLPYKLTFILHGIPGTGKTSLIKALASYFERNLCILNINSLSDGSFQSALSTVPDGSFIALEDFDSSKATGIRRSSLRNKKSNKMMDVPVNKNTPTIETRSDYTDVYEMLTLTGILNGLDGIKSIHNTVIFLTTNHLENIDPAVYRKGRVDHIVELKEVPAEDVRAYSKYIFPEYDFDDSIPFTDTLGCNLNSALLNSKGDPERYLKNLLEENEEKVEELMYN